MLLLTLACLPVIVFGRQPPDWLPSPVRNWSFDIQLTIAPLARKLASISHGSFREDRVYFDKLGERIEFQNDGLTLVGTLYRPQAAGDFPAVLLLHGSTSEGRKLGLYRYLGKELAERGYLVLGMDLRGYGESDDPPTMDQVSAFDGEGDVERAIDTLSSQRGYDGERFYIIAHSAGNDAGIPVGINDARIDKIASIGPPRRVEERFQSLGENELAYFNRRAMRDMQLSQPIPLKVYLAHIQEMKLEDFLDYFSSAGHKPVLFVDGELEDEADRIYLKEYFDSIVEPKEYLTLSDADHYANIANFGPLVFYDQRVAAELVDALDEWFSSP